MTTIQDQIAALQASPNKLYARLEMRMKCGRIKLDGRLEPGVAALVLKLVPDLPVSDDEVGQNVVARVRLRKRGQQDVVLEGPARHAVMANMMRLALGQRPLELVQ